MTSSRDVKDMLGLPAQQSPLPKPSKKAKKDNKKGPEGSQWNKELKSLMGERAPPLPLAAGPKWKDKRNRMMGPVRKWRKTPFKNDARTDGLLLRHWQRLADDHSKSANGISLENGESKQEQLDPQGSYRFAKYNQVVPAPSFTQQEYEEHLKNERWTEHETRYLMSLYHDFYGKWPLITDRYEYVRPAQQEVKDNENVTADQPSLSPQHQRRMEELKYRFYEVCAKVKALRTPPSQMTEAEYRDHDIMMKFNPQQELTRKKIKEQQMARSKEEMNEEKYLLAELKRIYANQERFDAELRELHTRLDHSLTDDKLGPGAYTSSTELTQLFQRFAMQDKSKNQQKMPQARRSIPGEGIPTGSAGSPTAVTPGGLPQKKGGASANESANTRNLPPKAEARYGVSTHDRLTSGITFVSDKITKARSPTKSSVQNSKVAAILSEVGIPEVMQMQTPAVCEEMERLVDMALGLLKNRQAMEKIENETLVLRKQLEMDGIVQPQELAEEQHQEEGLVRAEDNPEKAQNVISENARAENGELVAADGPADEAGDQRIKTEDQDAATDGREQPQRGGSRKRSVSVLSAASGGSRGGPKRKGARKAA